MHAVSRKISTKRTDKTSPMGLFAYSRDIKLSDGGLSDDSDPKSIDKVYDLKVVASPKKSKNLPAI
jgi:hypothetical protein